MIRYKGINNSDLLSQLSESVINVDKYIYTLNKKFDEAKKDFKFVKDSIIVLNKILNDKFKKYRIKFKIIKKDEIQKHSDYRYGLIIAETLLDKHSTIIIYCNKNIISIIDSEKIFDEFKSRCIKYIQHELIHRLQLIDITNKKIKRKLSSNDKDVINYFSNKHEIMAFAWQIVEELRLSGFTDEEIENKLKTLNFSVLHSQALTTYLKLFDKNDDTLKLLFKYIYMYLTEQYSDKNYDKI